MLPHPFLYAVPQSHQKQLRSLSSRKLHGRDKVAVSGDEYDNSDLVFQRQAGDVQPYTHIYTFLADIGLEISGADLDSGPGTMEHPALHAPAFMDELAKTQCKEWFSQQLSVKALISRGGGTRTKIHNSAAQRCRRYEIKRLGVVKVDPMEMLARDARQTGNLLGKRSNARSVRRVSRSSEFVTQEACVEQYCVAVGHPRRPFQKRWPQSGWGTNPSYMTPTKQPFLAVSLLRGGDVRKPHILVFSLEMTGVLCEIRASLRRSQRRPEDGVILSANSDACRYVGRRTRYTV